MIAAPAARRSCPTEDQGYLIANVPAAAGRDPGANARGDAAGRGLLPEPARGRQDGERARLQRSPAAARTPALAFVPLKPWDEREGAERIRRRRSPGAPSARSPGVRDAFVFALVPPAIPELGTATGFSLPPAGPRRQRPRRAGRGAQPVARHGGAEQGAGRRASRRPGGRAAAPGRHRPRPGQRARRLVRQHQRRALDRARLATTSTTSRTPAGCSASSSRPTRRDRMQPDDLMQLNVVNNQGKPVPLAALATTRWITGPIQTIRYNGYPSMRISGDAGAGLLDRRRDGRDGAPRRPAARPASPSSGPASRARSASRARRRRSCSRFSMLAVFLCLVGALRELVDPVRGAAGGAARRARRGGRRDAARHAERRLLQGRPDHRDRPVGEERDPDHRVRQGPAWPRART